MLTGINNLLMGMKEECCTKNITIAVLAMIFFSVGMYFGMIHHHNNIVILLLWFTILMEMAKTVIQMLVEPDAPVMLRYAMAGMVYASVKELYIFFLAKDIMWMGISAGAIVFFMIMRYWALKMTKEGR